MRAERFQVLLAGGDGPGKKALPAGEFLHPVPLAALALLLANDHLFKGAGVFPGWLTGKLSDVAGLVFFPLLLTALLDSLLWGAAQLGSPLDFTLRPGKLAGALALTAALFCAVKLSPSAAACFDAALGRLGLSSRVVCDPTDLLALPALAVAYWIGRRSIARVPLGRIELVERRRRRGGLARPAADQLADVIAAGADPGDVDVFAHALDTYLDRPADEELCREVRRALCKLRSRR